MCHPHEYFRLFLLINCIFFSFKGISQVGINTSSPSPAAVLDVNSSIDGTNFGGFMPPKVTLAQRNNIVTTSNDDGLMVFLSEGNNRCVQIFNAVESNWGNVYCMPVNFPPVASNVQIAGLYQENQTLTASFDYTDAESDAPGAHIYTWIRANDSSGSGQVVLQTSTSNTYLLTASEVSFFIAVEVTPVATTGTSPGSPVTSAFGGPVTDAAAVLVLLAGWEMNGLINYGPSPYAASTTSPSVVVGGLTRGSGVGIGGSAATDTWGGNGFNVTSQANAISENKFATFSITPSPGANVSITDIDPYNIRRSGTGPTTGIWQYSINGGAFVNIGTQITWGGTTAAGNLQSPIDLSGIPALQNLTSATTVTFRIVNWGASSAGGTWYINDFTAAAGGLDLIVRGYVN